MASPPNRNFLDRASLILPNYILRAQTSPPPHHAKFERLMTSHSFLDNARTRLSGRLEKEFLETICEMNSDTNPPGSLIAKF